MANDIPEEPEMPFLGPEPSISGSALAMGITLIIIICTKYLSNVFELVVAYVRQTFVIKSDDITLIVLSSGGVSTLHS